MAVIHAVGGEIECWTPASGQAAAVETTSGRFDATLSRGAMKVTNASSEIYLEFASQTEAWIHMHLYQEGVEFGSQYILLMNGIFNVYAIDMEADGTWSVYRLFDAGFEPLGSTALPVLIDAGARIDIHVKRHASTGIFRIYKDGTQIFSFTGDTSTDQTSFNRLWMQGLAGSGNEMNVSQVIVADVDTRDMRLATLVPSADGAQDKWVGTYLDVDNSLPDDDVAIESAVLDETSTFLTSGVDVAYTAADVHGLFVFLAASNHEFSAIDDVNAVLRVDGVDYPSTNLGLPNDGEIYFLKHAYALDPPTVGAVNVAEIGVRGWFE